MLARFINTDLAPRDTCRLGGGRVQQRNNGACLSFSPREKRSSSLALKPDNSVPPYMSLVLSGSLPSLVLRVSLCLGPLSGCLGLQQPGPLSHLMESILVFTAGSYRDSFSQHWCSSWGAQYMARTPCFSLETQNLDIPADA